MYSSVCQRGRVEETEGKRQRGKDTREETQERDIGKRQRERDRGEETEGKRQRGKDREEETEGKRGR